MERQRAEVWHQRALAIGAQCQDESRRIVEGRASTVLDAAVTVLQHDLLIAHRSVLTIVGTGWSSSAAAVVRSMLDMFISQLAMYRSTDVQFDAFKYLYASYRTLSRDGGASSAERQHARDVLRDRIAILPEGDRGAALRYLREKDRPYWFAPEWRSPSELLERLGVPLSFVYRQFSAAAHGGFLGIRLFRDDPDRLDINPRLPPGYRPVGVVNISTKIVLEACAIRSEYEGLPSKEIFRTAASAFDREVMATSIFTPPAS